MCVHTGVKQQFPGIILEDRQEVGIPVLLDYETQTNPSTEDD
jgi:hypothetical protein